MSDFPRVRCLCCGELYDSSGDCPRLDKQEHSAALALLVAARLRASGVESAPTRSQVVSALHEVRAAA